MSNVGAKTQHVAKQSSGVGFRWGHCQVLVVSQCDVRTVSSVNPVSHDTCTRGLPHFLDCHEPPGRRRKLSNTGANKYKARCAKQSSWFQILFGVTVRSSL